MNDPVFGINSSMILVGLDAAVDSDLNEITRFV